MKGEVDEITSKQASKRDKTLPQIPYNLFGQSAKSVNYLEYF